MDLVLVLISHGIFAGALAGVLCLAVCGLGSNLDRGLLIHLAQWCQFDTAWVLNDVVGRSIANGMLWIPVFTVTPGAHCTGIHVLRVRGNGRQVVFRLSAAAGKSAVTAVMAGFGFDDQVATGQGVQKDIDHTGTRNHRTCNTEEDNVRGVSLGRSHTSGGQWKREDNVGNRVDNHVSDNTTQTLETVRVAASQDSGLRNSATQLKPHNGVEGDGPELGKENPDVVCP